MMSDEQRDLDDFVLKLEHESLMASARLGRWMSAALDDPKVCDEMKDDIRRWFSSGHMYWNDVLLRMKQTSDERQEKIIEWLRNQDGYGEWYEVADFIERGDHLK